MRRDAGDQAGALALYEESLAIARKLAAALGNASRQVDVVRSLRRVGTRSDPLRSRDVLREALAILDALVRERKLTAAQQAWPQMLRDALAKLPAEQAGPR